MEKVNGIIELLAPAKDFIQGKAAIDHGADAVYIGAPKFSARSAASNDISEIEKLIKYAHLYHVKVYIALNTILYDDEINEALQIVHSLYAIGIDGLIIQDMAFLQLNLPPVPLIASTQTHNTTIDKIQFLESSGFKRVILARELNLKQIKEIRENTTLQLESFVHGALCVSYSGQCYMSEAICQRSGNRGVCAQPCRSIYDLIDSNGNLIIKDKHLLSLKDLNLSAYIGKMIDAGISSFKIEGRLKDITYVKNITAYYRKLIDKELETRNGLQKSSSGIIDHYFIPDPERSFNRGFTQYFITGRIDKTGSINSQKSLGKRLGYVIELKRNKIKIDSEDISNGDGLCFFGKDDILYGFAVQKVIGNSIFVLENKMIDKMEIGTEIFRNHDQKFEKQLLNNSATRRIGVELIFKETSNSFELQAIDTDGNTTSITSDYPKTIAKKPELSQKTLEEQLSKSGNSIFEVKNIKFEINQIYFFPVGIINSMRRDVILQLENIRIANYQPPKRENKQKVTSYFETGLNYLANISNKYAEKFYVERDVKEIETALELTKAYSNKTVMITKHCIRYQFDACPVYQKGKIKFELPLFLKDINHTYRLDFDCKKCEMHVIFEK